MSDACDRIEDCQRESERERENMSPGEGEVERDTCMAWMQGEGERVCLR